MKPIPNWRRAWRMASVQIAGAALLFGALPADQQAAMLQLMGLSPERIPALLGLAIIVARLIDQPAVNPQPAQPPRSGNELERPES
jgi:hypothetical protein